MIDEDHVIAVLSESDSATSSAGATDFEQSTLVEVDPAAGKVRSLAQHETSRRPRYITDVEVSGDFVVWTETGSTALDVFPWDLYSLDLRSMKERHLASSSDFGIPNPPPPSPTYDQQIVALGDRVYFPAIDNISDSGIPSSIYSVPLTSTNSKPELVAPSAFQVFADGDKLRVMTSHGLLSWDPSRGAGGMTTDLLATKGGGFFGDSVAILSSKDGSKLTIAEADGTRTVLDVSAFRNDVGEVSPGYLYANSRWAGFTVSDAEGDQGYVFDLRRKQVFKLDGVSNSPEYTLGDHWLPNAVTKIRPPWPRKLQFFKLKIGQ